jgi:predicted nucleotidyltransferase
MASTQPRIEIPEAEIAAFCRRWDVVELALFGSVMRDDFRPDSDIDVMVKSRLTESRTSGASST